MAEANRLYRPDQYERQPNDFYPTPPEATQYLLETVPLRDFVWEPCAGQGLMAKTIADAGYRVVASDVVEYENSVFPIITGIDALELLLPAGVKTVVTNPPYGNMPRKLIPYWLSLLEPVGGMLCLLMNSLWGESQSGQLLTSLHRAYAGKVRTRRRIRWLAGTPLDKGGAPQIDHAWLIWDWNRDPTKLPFDLSPGDPRLKSGCAVCDTPLDGLRTGAKTCSARCRAALSRRRARA